MARKDRGDPNLSVESVLVEVLKFLEDISEQLDSLLFNLLCELESVMLAQVVLDHEDVSELVALKDAVLEKVGDSIIVDEVKADT